MRTVSPSHFPHPEFASPEGIVAAGAAPTPELLEDAYQHGIFPWPHEGLPLLWFSPDPRFVIELPYVYLGRSLKKAMRKRPYIIKADTRFPEVMQACAQVHRPGQGGTWITDEMLDGYTVLHERGVAHSIEAFDGDTLVGGLYGVSFGRAFFGESMFAHAPDASKVAFATLCAHLIDWGFHFVDCQVYTDHLARFGAEEIPREAFLIGLDRALDEETKPGPWSFALDSADALLTIADAIDRTPAPENDSFDNVDEGGDDV